MCGPTEFGDSDSSTIRVVKWKTYRQTLSTDMPLLLLLLLLLNEYY